MVKIGKWDYPDDCMDTNKINNQIKKDFSMMCKEKKINKSKLVEEFYKLILIRFKQGNLVGGYITMNLSKFFNKPR